VHESAYGTKLPSSHVRLASAFGVHQTSHFAAVTSAFELLVWWTAPAPGIEVP
jgi:hypothetical protein